jgi:hypothetical protein
VDMGRPGALAARLRQWRKLPLASRPRPDVDRVRARFDWLALKPAYAALYRRMTRAATGR